MSRLTQARLLSRVLPGVAILIAGAGIASALIATTPSAPGTEPEERAHSVSVQVIEPGRRSPTVAAYGRVEAAAITDLEAPVSAPVARVNVREGQWVEAGEVLVELDDRQARLDLRSREADTAEARAELASLRAEQAMTERMAAEQQALADLAAAKLARFENLFERQMIARALLDEVREDAARARLALTRHDNELADFPNRIARQQAAVTRAEVAAERVAIDLERTRIRAPFDGPVLAVHVARGNQVMQGTPLIRLADADSFEVRATLPAEHAAALRAELGNAGADGLRASGELGEEQLTLQLTRLAGAQKSGRTGIDAFFRFPAHAGIELGRVVDLSISLPEQPGLVALPVQAIFENGRIYRIEDSRLVAMDVDVVGASNADEGYRLLVRSPELRAGQRIITTALPQAMTGLKVAPVGERVASSGDDGAASS